MRTTVLLVMLLASFGVPYFLLAEGGIESVVDRWYGRSADGSPIAEADPYDVDTGYDSSAASRPASLASFSSGTSSSSSRSNLPVEFAPIMNLEDVINFNITPPWVLGHWPHVTTGLVQGQLFGYRVPLVTGTDENDVTGSLTYYFGPTQRLETITFQGDTGDGRRLISWITSQMGLQRQVSNEHGVYLYRRIEDAKVYSELRVRPGNVIQASKAQQRFDIEMVLNRPPEPQKGFWSS